ncbi:MAG: fibronectin type III domain-containing protein [Bacteroidota bacterium]
MNTKKYCQLLLFIFIQSINAIGQTAPPTPTGLLVTATNCRKITLTWDAFPEGTIVGAFEIYRSETGENGNYLKINLKLDIENHTYIDDDEFNQIGKIYHYKIKSLIGQSESDFSNIVSSSFQCPPPTGLTTTSNACGKITISWDIYPSNRDFLDYEIYRSDNGEFGNYNLINSVPEFLTSYEDQVPNIAITYYYKLAAKIIYTNTGFSNVVSGKVICPPPVLLFNGSSCGKINLEWNKRLTFIPIPVNVYRSDNGENGDFYLIDEKWSGYDYFDTESNMIPFKQYFYKIQYTGVNDFSNIVSGSFNCQTPTNLRVISANCDYIRLQWDEIPNQQYSVFQIYKSVNGENGQYYQINSTSENVFEYKDGRTGMYGQPAAFSNHYKIKLVGPSNLQSEFSNIAFGSFICSGPLLSALTSTFCGQININWVDNTPNLVELGFQIYRSETLESNYTLINSVGPNEYNYIDKYNLADGQTYFYKIKGILNGGLTEFSNVNYRQYNCQFNSNIRITNSGCGQVTLAWDDFPNGINESGFKIYRSQAENGVYAILDQVNSNVYAYRNDTELVLNTTYYYKVSGIVNGFETNLGTPAQVNYICESPKNFRVNSSTCGRISLAWDDYSDGIYEEGFTILGSTDGINYTIFSNPSSNSTNIQLTDLPGPQYSFKIYGRFGFGNSIDSEPIQGTTNCSQELALKATSHNCTEIYLSWNHILGSVGYKIFRSFDNEPFSELVNSMPLNNYYTDKDLANNASYKYYVLAIFNSGVSEPSIIASELASCPIPKNFRIVPKECGSITMQWDDYLYGIEETGYKIYKATVENGIYTTVAIFTSNFLNFTDNEDLNLGQTYYYKIMGLFNNYISDFSSPISSSLNYIFSIQTGQWNDPTTWSCGRVPTDLDEIIINAGHTVTIGENITANGKNLENNGTLILGFGSNLILKTP